MPFNLHLRRAGSRLGADDFEQLMRAFSRSKRGDGRYWTYHPSDELPFFEAALRTDGSIVFSTSYSNHRFVRNFVDLLDLAPQAAARIGAQAFEEVGGRELTPATVDELVASGGRYVKLQVNVFRETRDKMAEQQLAGLELPLEALDLVPEYLLVHVQPKKQLEAQGVAALLEAATDAKAEPVPGVQRGAWLLKRDGPKGDLPLGRVLHRDDGQWQLWPVWGHAPFAELLAATRSAAEALAEATAGGLKLAGRSCPPRLWQAVLQRANRGLGVEFFEFVREQFWPKPPEEADGAVE